MFSKDVRHLWVLAGVLLMVGLGYAGIRKLVTPPTWGQFGHYRGSAVEQLGNLKQTLVARDTCAGCHTAIAEKMGKGKHAKVHCQDCHGNPVDHVTACQLAAEATKAAGNDPTQVHCAHDNLKPTALKPICLHCHQKTVGRPEKFPQIVFEEHMTDQGPKDAKSNNVCFECHSGHDPSETPESPEDKAAAAAAAAAPAAAPATPTEPPAAASPAAAASDSGDEN